MKAHTSLKQFAVEPLTKALANKATYKHHIRQIADMATMVSDAHDPIIKKHDGNSIGKNMISTLKEFNIAAEQSSESQFSII